ncbi:MAG: hypothetical protein VX640_10680 [Pseudomonadota bacterium]|nr:hypothetical protein [Pseudomonadota bacterium]
MRRPRPYKLDSPWSPAISGRIERGLYMTAVYLIAAFVIVMASLNILEKGRLD